MEKGNLAATSAHGKKRVWRRWGPSEEEALQRAVEKHGTKDWMAIVQVRECVCVSVCLCVCVCVCKHSIESIL